MDTCGILPLLDLEDLPDLPDLDDDFFCLLEQQDIFGDLPLLPDGLTAAQASCQPAPPKPLCEPAATAAATRQPLPGRMPAAAPIVASCFAAPTAQATGRASWSSCSSDAFSGLPSSVAQASASPSPPGSPVSSSQYLPASSSGSVLADLPATQWALQLTSSSSGGVCTKPPAARGASECQQQQQQAAKPMSKQQIAASKRKAPEIDWKTIDDPEERRKQRRLAKNRITAARSRERKKEQMAGMEEQMAAVEAENSSMRALMEQLAQENTRLKEQLSSRISGAAVASLNTQAAAAEPAVLKCVVIMHLAACLLCVRASLSLVVLLAALCQWALPAVTAASCGAGAGSPRQVAMQPLLVDGCAMDLRRWLRPTKHWESCGAGSWWQESGRCHHQLCRS